MPEKFIPIDELIERAKFFGVDFGKGDPRNRLRYYTKIGLLPHAVRKSFNGKPPTGAYPESVLKILVEIDKKLKEGKKIQQIKRELKKEKKERERLQKEIEREEIEIEEIPKIKRERFLKIKFSKKIAIPILVSLFVFGILIFANNFLKTKPKDILTNFLAQVSKPMKIVQAPKEVKAEILPPPSIEPFLTINAETLVRPSLRAEEFLSAPIFVFQNGERRAILETAELTADRTFTLPDESGIICLSTGNCVAIVGEVLTPGGTENRLAKFTGPNRISNSSIVDRFAGISLAIDERGNIGIGTENPRTKLDVRGNSIFSGKMFVEGEIEATGDVCTRLQGGKCLSQLITAFFGGGVGIGGSGTPGYFPIFVAPTRLGDSILRQSGNTLYLSGDFDLSGLLRVTSFQLVTSSVRVGYVLTAVSTSGLAAWMPPPSGTIPTGQYGFTLRHDDGGWVADDFLYNTGSFIGIGTTSTLATLAVAGTGYFENSLTINSSSLSQLILQLGNDQFILEIDPSFARISSPKDLIINSLTGHIFATSSIISASSFVAYDATVRAPGEHVFREAIPIFKFPIPAETATTSFVQVSKTISTSTIISQQLKNTQRKIAFLINMADNIPTTSSSTWQITDLSGTPITTFEIQGHQMSSLDEGKAVLTDFMDLPNNDWILKVAVPSDSKIRIFNILLLVFDQIQ